MKKSAIDRILASFQIPGLAVVFVLIVSPGYQKYILLRTFIVWNIDSFPSSSFSAQSFSRNAESDILKLYLVSKTFIISMPAHSTELSLLRLNFYMH